MVHRLPLLVTYFFFPFIMASGCWSSSYYTQLDFDNLSKNNACVGAAPLCQDYENISKSFEQVPYINDVWRVYLQYTDQSTIYHTPTASFIRGAEQLLGGKPLEVNLNYKTTWSKKYLNDAVDSRLYIGLKQISLKFNYTF